MIFPELNTIKIRRHKLAIRQKELAEICKISQSLIAKIESEKINPSYDVVRRVFNVLDSLEHKNEKKCYEMMIKNVFFVQENDEVKRAIDIMKKNSVSQLPVLKNNQVIGTISESIIYAKILQGISKKPLEKMLVKEIMTEPFPVIGADYPISAAMPLLKSSEAILLTEKHKIVGIITKSNLL